MKVSKALADFILSGGDFADFGKGFGPLPPADSATPAPTAFQPAPTKAVNPDTANMLLAARGLPPPTPSEYTLNPAQTIYQDPALVAQKDAEAAAMAAQQEQAHREEAEAQARYAAQQAAQQAAAEAAAQAEAARRAQEAEQMRLAQEAQAADDYRARIEAEQQAIAAQKAKEAAQAAAEQAASEQRAKELLAQAQAQNAARCPPGSILTADGQCQSIDGSAVAAAPPPPEKVSGGVVIKTESEVVMPRTSQPLVLADATPAPEPFNPAAQIGTRAKPSAADLPPATPAPLPVFAPEKAPVKTGVPQTLPSSGGTVIPGPWETSTTPVVDASGLPDMSQLASQAASAVGVSTNQLMFMLAGAVGGYFLKGRTGAALGGAAGFFLGGRM